MISGSAFVQAAVVDPVEGRPENAADGGRCPPYEIAAERVT